MRQNRKKALFSRILIGLGRTLVAMAGEPATVNPGNDEFSVILGG